jgi:hypothetical protein
VRAFVWIPMEQPIRLFVVTIAAAVVAIAIGILKL